MNRTPPAQVRQALRKEVGFGCPVPGCGSPYLEWHHFNPPWRVREHHEPGGMVALCAEHHRKADGGSFTSAQLAQFKNHSSTSSVKGRFDWMRRRLLVVAGGNFCLETNQILRVADEHLIHLSRDSEGHLLLSVRFPRDAPARLELADNDWIAHGDHEDLECPPSGKLLHARYPNRDRVKVEFMEFDEPGRLAARYPFVPRESWEKRIDFPIATVAVEFEMPERGIGFDARGGHGGSFAFRGNFLMRCGTAISI